MNQARFEYNVDSLSALTGIPRATIKRQITTGDLEITQFDQVLYWLAENMDEAFRTKVGVLVLDDQPVSLDKEQKQPLKVKPSHSGNPLQAVEQEACYYYTYSTLAALSRLERRTVYQHQFRGYLNPERLDAVLLWAARHSHWEVKAQIIQHILLRGPLVPA